MTENSWQDARVSASLSIEPHGELRGFWTIRGHGGEPAISASSRDLAEFGTLLVESLQEEATRSKVNWIWKHWAETGASLRESVIAWESMNARQQNTPQDDESQDPRVQPDYVLNGAVTTSDIEGLYICLQETENEGELMPDWGDLPVDERVRIITICETALAHDRGVNLIDVVYGCIEWNAILVRQNANSTE